MVKVLLGVAMAAILLGVAMMLLPLMLFTPAYTPMRIVATPTPPPEPLTEESATKGPAPTVEGKVYGGAAVYPSSLLYAGLIFMLGFVFALGVSLYFKRRMT